MDGLYVKNNEYVGPFISSPIMKIFTLVTTHVPATIQLPRCRSNASVGPRDSGGGCCCPVYQSHSLLLALVHEDLWVKITCPEGTGSVQVLVDVCKEVTSRDLQNLCDALTLNPNFVTLTLERRAHEGPRSTCMMGCSNCVENA